MLKLLRSSIKHGQQARWPFVRSQRTCCPGLPETHQKLQETCREFADAELVPNAVICDREQLYPKEQIKKMGELGLMGVAVPEEFCGAGLDYLAYSVALEEIARGCATCGVIMAMNNALFLEPILVHGTDDQKLEFVAPYVNGECIGCFGHNEPDKPSSNSALVTTAVLDGDHYILNGIKTWSSNAVEANAALVFATTDASQDKTSMSTFMVRYDSEGFSLGKRDDNNLGLRGHSTCPLIFENCKIPKENILGEPGDGLRNLMTVFNAGRIGIASQAVGIAQASLELAARYADKRVVYGTLISKLQAIQFKLADMGLKVESARLLTRRAAWLKDNGKPFTKEAAMAKISAAEAATWCSHQCIQILGAIGFGSELPAERYYRDARATEIYVGTSEIHRVSAAQEILQEYGGEKK